MGDDIARATALLLPGGRIDVVAYGCTSGSMVIGEERVFAEIRKARPGVKCTTPPTAALAAFRALRLRRIAVLTPYPRDINEQVRRYLAERELEIAAFGSFGKPTDPEIAAIAPDSIVSAARSLDAPDIDGIFLSCTGMRGLAAVAPLEAALGKPVVSSNQALAWHAMRLADCGDAVPGAGSLFRY
jgi:maleate isomerase